MRELKAQIDSHALNGVYLLYGAERYLVRLYKDLMQKSLFESEDEMFLNVSVLDEPKAVGDIIQALETLPFMAEKRLVIIRNSGAFVPGDDFDALAEAIENLDTTVAVFDEEKVNKTSKMYKKVAKIGKVVEFATQSEADLAKWIMREAKNDGKELSPAVSSYFISYVGTDMTNILNQWEKLKAYVGDRPEISNEDINKICTADIRDQVYDIINAIAQKKAATALKVYSELISRSTAPQLVLYSIISQFRTMLRVSLLLKEGKRNPEIAGTLGLSVSRVGYLVQEAGKFGEAMLRTILEELLETDASTKNGNLDANDACMVFILRYASV